MIRLFLLLFFFSTFCFGQTIIFDASNKWVLPLGRNSEATEKLKYPLRVELKAKKLKLFYPDQNRFYYEQLETPIESVRELNVDGRTFFMLEFFRDGLTHYFRITKDHDPNYGILYGIEIPQIENGVVIAYETFY
ncbi:hypothetical protein [Namhaeicola litoreus]|uniref:Uncharacterized protein n=1 Tax=Namhaeicola litoreus TaxID=1052145 RepID=A0ABW3Y020_9FLAO